MPTPRGSWRKLLNIDNSYRNGRYKRVIVNPINESILLQNNTENWPVLFIYLFICSLRDWVHRNTHKSTKHKNTQWNRKYNRPLRNTLLNAFDALKRHSENLTILLNKIRLYLHVVVCLNVNNAWQHPECFLKPNWSWIDDNWDSY